MQKKLKVAIVHYWLVSMRGGEKALEQICEIYPEADIFTLVCKPEKLSDAILKHRIVTSFIQRLPFGVSKYQHYLPLMLFAIEAFDLTGYDLVITSDTNVTKGVVLPPGVLHVNYCHTPMRYAWDMYHDYLNNSGLGRVKKMIMSVVMSYLRVWDVAASNRVDYFIANSGNVRRRIAKHYRRDAEVVFPPVSVHDFDLGRGEGEFYLMAGQIIPYKRVDLAVDAFNRSGRELVIIGEGSDLAKLKAKAKKNVRFLGHQSFASLRDHFARCKAFIFPGEEDFGITLLEAQACGRPVIAYAKGGALETVADGSTGLFFSEQDAESLNAAVDRYENGDHAITADKCRENALKYSNERFREHFKTFISNALSEHRARH